MLQIYAYSLSYLYRPYDLQGTITPSTNKTEWLISTCLNQAGLSGYLKPGASSRILE